MIKELETDKMQKDLTKKIERAIKALKEIEVKNKNEELIVQLIIKEMSCVDFSEEVIEGLSPERLKSFDYKDITSMALIIIIRRYIGNMYDINKEAFIKLSDSLLILTKFSFDLKERL